MTAPAAQGDALDQGVREELSIGKAINRAARDLPEGWEIRIDLERHAGVVHLTDPEGNETMIDGSGELFSDQINDAIDAALASAAQPAADGALNTIAAMFLSGEEIEGPDGLAMMVDMALWNDALDSFEVIIGNEMEPAKEQA